MNHKVLETLQFIYPGMQVKYGAALHGRNSKFIITNRIALTFPSIIAESDK